MAKRRRRPISRSRKRKAVVRRRRRFKTLRELDADLSVVGDRINHWRRRRDRARLGGKAHAHADRWYRKAVARYGEILEQVNDQLDRAGDRDEERARRRQIGEDEFGVDLGLLDEDEGVEFELRAESEGDTP